MRYTDVPSTEILARAIADEVDFRTKNLPERLKELRALSQKRSLTRKEQTLLCNLMTYRTRYLPFPERVRNEGFMTSITKIESGRAELDIIGERNSKRYATIKIKREATLFNVEIIADKSYGKERSRALDYLTEDVYFTRKVIQRIKNVLI